MRKLRWLVLGVVLLPLLVSAQEITIVPRDTTLTGNAFKTGQRVDIDGTVEGDAIVFGTDVTVAGEVKGDLIVGAQKLVVTGTVGGSLRAAATDISLSGSVGRNVTVVGQSMTQTSDAKVQGSFSFAGQTLRQGGNIEGSLDTAVETLIVNGSVGKDVRVHNGLDWRGRPNGTTTIGAGAKIGGALVHTGVTVASVDAAATIAGGVSEQSPTVSTGRTLPIIGTFWRLTGLFGLLIVGLVLLWLFRRENLEIIQAMTASPLKSLVLGIGVFLGLPILSLVLLVTIIGIPLSLILVGIYLLGLYLTRVYAALVIGQALITLAAKRKLRLPTWRPLPLVLGLLTIVIVVDFFLNGTYAGGWRWLNNLGGIVNFFILFWALGGMVLGKARVMKNTERS